MKYKETKVVINWKVTKGTMTMKHHVVGAKLPRGIKVMVANSLLNELNIPIRIEK